MNGGISMKRILLCLIVCISLVSCGSEGENLFSSKTSSSENITAFENNFFHKLYTDVASVQIHEFKERGKTIEVCMGYLTEFLEGDTTNFHYLTVEKRLFKTEYLQTKYCCDRI